MEKSIRTQLLFWILIPLLLLSVLSAAVTYWSTADISEEIYDEMLLNSADSVIARVTLYDGKVGLTFSKVALAVLRHEGKDDFYFKVTDSQGNFLLGDRFESWTPTSVNTHTEYKNGFINGASVRMSVTPFEPRRSPPDIPQPRLSPFVLRYSAKYEAPNNQPVHFFVHCAETCHARTAVARHVLKTSLLLELLSVLGGAIAVWFGVGRGLLPLRQIQEAISRRTPWDLDELQIAKPPRELVSLVATINRVHTLLRKHIEEQATFVSNAAHELRTPLAGLKTYVDLGRRHASSPKEEEVFGNLNLGVGRMSNLVNKLLALAKAESNSAVPKQIERLDLNDIVHESLLALRPKADAKSITVEFESDSEPSMLSGDHQGLLELVDNLILNAIVYTPTNGKITITTASKDDTVRLTVEDTGPGIPEAERQKIFQRFYRILGSGADGSGLGLAIVKTIADSHLASVSVESGRDGRGCRFVVNFADNKLLKLTTAL